MPTGPMVRERADTRPHRRALRVPPLLLLFLLLPGACTARYQPMAAPDAPPRLTDAAIVAADGYALPLRQWRPRGRGLEAVVLALHGFNDHSNSFAAAGRFLQDRGILIYAYDQRGFGATRGFGVWPGTATLVADLATAVELVARRHPELPLYVMGESMGGAVAMVAAAGGAVGATAAAVLRRRVAGLILVAPAVWGRRAMTAIERVALAAAVRLVPGLKLGPPRGLNIQPSDNLEMLRALGRDPKVIKATRVDAIHGLVDLMDRALAAAPRVGLPALVLYGAREEVLPRTPIRIVLDTLPDQGRTTVVYPDGWHMLLRDRQAEVVLADIAAWLDDPAAPLPSGLDAAARSWP